MAQISMASLPALKDSYVQLKTRMDKAVEDFRKEMTSTRTGRASVHMLDGVMVEAYGSQMPLNQLANVSAPEPQLITVQPWDVSQIGAIEKAIRSGDLGLNPMNDGKLVRVPVPALTEDRRKEMVKHLNRVLEEHRTAVRNIRRDGNDSIKKAMKDKKITEDEERGAMEHLQKLTDDEIKKMEEMAKGKEKAFAPSWGVQFYPQPASAGPRSLDAWPRTEILPRLGRILLERLPHHIVELPFHLESVALLFPHNRAPYQRLRRRIAQIQYQRSFGVRNPHHARAQAAPAGRIRIHFRPLCSPQRISHVEFGRTRSHEGQPFGLQRLLDIGVDPFLDQFAVEGSVLGVQPCLTDGERMEPGEIHRLIGFDIDLLCECGGHRQQPECEHLHIRRI